MSLGMLAGCVEYSSSSDYATAKGVCTSHGSTWATSCPTGKIGGCKVPPGAAGGAPGGTIRWSYQGTITCAAGETMVKADGVPGDAGATAPATDAGPAIPVGPGGPISAGCKTELMTVSPFNNVYPICTGEPACNSCITTDYAAPSCQMNKNFKAMLAFMCLTPGKASYPSCAKECGH